MPPPSGGSVRRIPDLVFFGASCTRLPNRSDAFQASAIKAAIGVARFGLVGVSYGGSVGYRMAAMFPDAVDKVALVCASRRGCSQWPLSGRWRSCSCRAGSSGSPSCAHRSSCPPASSGTASRLVPQFPLHFLSPRLFFIDLVRNSLYWIRYTTVGRQLRLLNRWGTNTKTPLDERMLCDCPCLENRSVSS
jgi:pimeloyl-ACP methyl ester carboxylesterase